jgi:hypothetical protein
MRRSGAVGDESAGDTVAPRIEDSCEGIGESMCGSCRSIDASGDTDVEP